MADHFPGGVSGAEVSVTARPGRSESHYEPDDLRHGRWTFALWFAMLGGPFAAVCDGSILYATVSRACQNESAGVLHFICSVSILVAIAAWLTAFRIWRKTGSGEPNNKYGVMHRARFMAVVGLMSASLGILGIMMEWYPIFIIGPCNAA
jgi:hypothetical protein